MATLLETDRLIQLLFGTGATSQQTLQELAQFEDAALPIINQVWALEQLDEEDVWSAVPRYDSLEAQAEQGDEQDAGTDEAESARLYHQRKLQALSELSAVLGQRASALAATCWLHPQLWKPLYKQPGDAEGLFRLKAQARLLERLARMILLHQLPADWSSRVCHRIATICSVLKTGHDPDLIDCVGELLKHADPATGPLIEALSVGEWQVAWQELTSLALQSGPLAAPGEGWPASPHRLLPRSALPSGAERLKSLWQARGEQHAPALARRLYSQGALPAAFGRLCQALPDSLPVLNSAVSSLDDEDDEEQIREPELRRILQELIDAAVWELLRDFRPESWERLCDAGELRGGHVLLRLAEEVEQRGITYIMADDYGWDEPEEVLSQLFGALQRRHDDVPEALVELLRRLRPETLLLILPLARPYEREICEALGWAGAGRLLNLLRRLSDQHPDRSSDPRSGVIQRQELLELLGMMDETQLRALLAMFERDMAAPVTLVRAVLGWNRKELRQGLGRRSQLAARAFGLLPLEEQDELPKRYKLLKKYEQEIGASRAGRKAYERAAVRAGLTNLALQAGYADATRLEWAMEASLATGKHSFGRRWQIEGYTLALGLREGRPAVLASKDGVALKRTPRRVLQQYVYREVREALKQAREQARRYRQALLDSMRESAPISPEELQLLRRSPIASGLLERLIVIDQAGAIGLFCPEDGALEGLYGERVIPQGALTIAHPYALAQEGVLSNWQAEISRRQIVQPFKQAFRELYLLTPAKQQSVYSSARLAGRRLKSRQAMAVLANLGWVLDDGEVHKPFYQLGYAAHFEAGYTGHYDETSASTTGSLSFWPLDGWHHGSPERRVRLESIPPILLSEVLRDLDLVTVIAHQSEEHGASREVIARRAELVRALVSGIGLSQVEVQEPLVLVRGSRASYRIQLATGAIYLESGQYLCIVPSTRQQQRVYLPFEERGEPLISEIISKVLLLAGDSGIKDPSILSQIGQA